MVRGCSFGFYEVRPALLELSRRAGKGRRGGGEARDRTHVLGADGLDDLVRRRPQELGDDGELVDVVLAREQGTALQHLGKDAPCRPNVDCEAGEKRRVSL